MEKTKFTPTGNSTNRIAKPSQRDGYSGVTRVTRVTIPRARMPERSAQSFRIHFFGSRLCSTCNSSFLSFFFFFLVYNVG